MNKFNLNIWGRDFELPVSYDCYPGEGVLDTQIEAVESFLNTPMEVDNSKKNVETYILSNNSSDVGNSVVDNIFRYVTPKSLYIPRNKEKRVLAIMCDYRFDVEHGLAVVFENEAFKAVGIQDIVL